MRNSDPMFAVAMLLASQGLVACSEQTATPAVAAGAGSGCTGGQVLCEVDGGPGVGLVVFCSPPPICTAIRGACVAGKDSDSDKTSDGTCPDQTRCCVFTGGPSLCLAVARCPGEPCTTAADCGGGLTCCDSGVGTDHCSVEDDCRDGYIDYIDCGPQRCGPGLVCCEQPDLHCASEADCYGPPKCETSLDCASPAICCLGAVDVDCRAPADCPMTCASEFDCPSELTCCASAGGALCRRADDCPGAPCAAQDDCLGGQTCCPMPTGGACRDAAACEPVACKLDGDCPGAARCCAHPGGAICQPSDQCPTACSYGSDCPANAVCCAIDGAGQCVTGASCAPPCTSALGCSQTDAVCCHLAPYTQPVCAAATTCPAQVCLEPIDCGDGATCCKTSGTTGLCAPAGDCP